VSSPLLDDGPPAQVHELPLPDAEVEVVADVVEDREVALVVDAVVDVVLRLVDVVDVVVVDVVVAVVAVELVLRLADVVVPMVLLTAPPPPAAEAEATVAGVGVPALVAQKPNEVDCPAAIVAFHESGVTMSVPADAPKVPLHPLLSVALPIESVTVHEVTAALPPFATTTFSQ
jgi:hypothetical protein